ncbi:MAG TPA: hypothetical protein VET45_07990 [Candidatus Binatia bacterium]|nr:hypothetical protein [Candidatus Binatia bacterium]
MPPAAQVGVLVLGATLLVVLPVPAGAQPELQAWLNPEMGTQIPRSDYRFTYYPDRKVDDQETHFTLSEHRVTVFIPIYQDTSNEWALSAKTLFQDIDTRARFPEAGGRVPSELWDASAGLSYRHKFDNGWTGGLALTVGSASDEPFNSVDEMYFRVIGLLRVPQGERNSWIFTLIYASDEEIFGQVLPVPGIAYAWVPSDRFRAVIGFPFSMIQYKPFEKLALDVEYFPFWTVRTRATWEIARPLRAYAGFQWDSDHFYRADRDDKDDKIFYSEMRVYGGLRFDLRHVGFEVTGGYAFNRFYFEGDSYSDRHDNRIDVGPSPFVVGKVNIRF